MMHQSDHGAGLAVLPSSKVMKIQYYPFTAYSFGHELLRILTHQVNRVSLSVEHGIQTATEYVSCFSPRLIPRVLSHSDFEKPLKPRPSEDGGLYLITAQYSGRRGQQNVLHRRTGY